MFNDYYVRFLIKFEKVNNIYKIYGLTSTYDTTIKYIGLTSKSLNKRLVQHKYTSLKTKGRYTKKESWIRNRIQNKYELHIILLEDNLSKEEAMLLEISYISKYGLNNLTNLTVDGDGIGGYKYSYEQRLNWYNAIKVDCYDVNGIFLNTYNTISDASNKLNIHNSSIWHGINGNHIISGGYIFIKSNDLDMLSFKLNKINDNLIKLYNIQGELIDSSNSAEYFYKKYKLTHSITEFSKRLNKGIVPQSLCNEYFLLYPNFNLNVMLKSLQRYKTIDLNTNDIKYFIKIEDISKYLLVSDNLIKMCLYKLRKSAKNHLILKIDEEVPVYVNNHFCKIAELDINGKIIKKFNSIKECAIFYNIDQSYITKVCKGKREHVKKHIFRYIDDIV